MHTQAQIRARVEKERRRRQREGVKVKQREPFPAWRDFCLEVFPNYYRDNFGERHTQFWQHIEHIGIENNLPALIAIWPRGSGKSTTMEGSVARLGAKEVRRYCWYVCETQDQADKHVASVSSMLESRAVDRYYPALGRRLLDKYGQSEGWKRNLLRCGNGFTVEAIGLDKAVRGGKMDWARPDLIIFDDVDGRHDSPGTIKRKVETITENILPAGSTDVAVVFVQNLIHKDSIAARLAGVSPEKADFLLNRVVLGPYPAVTGLATEQTDTGIVIVAGEATWGGQSLEVCQAQINLWGLSAFLREAQHEVDDPPGGMFDHLVYRRCRWEEVPELVQTQVWVDPAVTATDQSDSMGIQADGIAADGTIYRLWSWEQVATPLEALKQAIRKAVELKASTIGVETDQGGLAWQSVFNEAWREMAEDGSIEPDTRKPRFREAKAGAGAGPKVHRAGQMLTKYEQGKFVHVIGTHQVLERALRRFPLTKPFDLVDACYWSWQGIEKRGWSR